jgi:hypothetical protein
MTHAEFTKKLDNIVSELDEYARKDAPTVIGNIAVGFFKGNFEKQGFVNNGVQEWQEVKRRQNLAEKYP